MTKKSKHNIDLSGKTCLVTGANSGIGKATAKALAAMGARIGLICRRIDAGEAARQEITAVSGNPNIDLKIADLTSQSSLKKLTDEINNDYENVHVLINNAGVMLKERSLTEDGLETHFALHVMAPFLLGNLLFEKLKAAAPARIINVASKAHFFAKMDFENLQGERGYSLFKAYNLSKLCELIISFEQARRFAPHHISVNCLHPGMVATRLGRNLPQQIVSFTNRFILTPEKGAQTSVYLASSPEVAEVTSKYFEKCKPARSSKAAGNPQYAESLWNLCEKMTRI